MKVSRRKRREWRIILWVSLTSAVISAYFGYAVVASPEEPPLRGILQGIITSLMIATPIVFFEVRRARFGSLRWLHHLPLAGRENRQAWLGRPAAGWARGTRAPAGWAKAATAPS